MKIKEIVKLEIDTTSHARAMAMMIRDSKEIEIKDEIGYVQASELLIAIRNKLREMETERRGWVDPLNQHVKKINSGYKEMAAPLEDAEQIVQDGILKFRARQDAKVEKKQEVLRERAKEEGVKTSMVPVLPKMATQVSTTRGQVVVSKVWDFEVEDKAKVPLEFLMIDTSAVRAAIKEGVRTIKGVRIFQKEVISARSN